MVCYAQYCMRFLIQIAANALGMLIASLVIPGFVFSGGVAMLLGLGVGLALANAVIRPLLKLVSLPLLIITLGLFSIVINMVVLKVIDWFFESLTIATIGALFWGTILLAVVNGLVSVFVRKKS